MVHATYQSGGLHGKETRFREGGMWLLDQNKKSYFSEPALTYENGVKASATCR